MLIKKNFVKECFEKLLYVKHLQIYVTDNNKKNCMGIANVSILKEVSTPNEIIHIENGFWKNKEGDISFSNRVKFVLGENSIKILHLRYHKNTPSFLVQLVELEKNLLSTSEPYLCKNDCYVAKMTIFEGSLFLGWKILGPKKDQEICIEYFSE